MGSKFIKKMVLESLYGVSLIKSKLLAGIFGIAVFFSPIGWTLFVVGVFIVLDTLFGRWAAKEVAKREGKDVRKEVVSKKTRRGTLDKMVIYLLLISLLYVMDKNLISPLIQWALPSFPIEEITTKLVGFILCLIEADSIDEKIYNVKGVRIKELIANHLNGLKKVITKVRETKDHIVDKMEE